jgi:4-hydroxybenzoate polyprenyltransferase
MDLRKLSKLILNEHTLFALPFAYLGILFAGGGIINTWIWITIAIVAASTAGLSFYRIIDADIETKNPSREGIAIPKGEASRSTLWGLSILASSLLIFSSYMLNSLCLYLSFVALPMLFIYSFIKRFSSATHFYLGLLEAAAPIGGYLAVKGEFDKIPFILGFAMMMWISGLDIVYAKQDLEFDTRKSLYSIPAIFGKGKALIISAATYILSIAALISAGMLTGRGIAYWISVICAAIILLREQILARRDSIESMDELFQINSFVSPILFLGTALDVFFDPS